MNRAAHQHGVLESFILRHSSPKILTKPPARIFAAYRFLFMICHVLGAPLDQQKSLNSYTTLNYQSIVSPKIKVTIPNHISISKLADPHHTQQISKSAIKSIPQIHQISNSPFH